MFDGVSMDHPLAAVPTFLTNLAERFTGRRDERHGYAIAHGAMALERIAAAAVRSTRGASLPGVVKLGGSALNLVGVGTGLVQVWNGWQQLQKTGEGPLGLLHNKMARSGLLQVAAGGLMFVPGPVAALAGAGLMLTSVANDLDLFAQLDRPEYPQIW